MLRAALAASAAGHGSLALIGGEAGAGKTTLAEALLAEAVEQGATVLIGRCYDLSETPPYGPWIEALGRATAVDGLPPLPLAVLPPGRDGAALVGAEAIQAGVRDFLAALAARRTVVLLLEDLHWADPASLDLLRAVARDLAARPLLLLATYRDDEIAPDHRLAALLPALAREARAARLDLRPLDAAAIGALVAARYAITGADHARLTRYLIERSDGNALFLDELLRTRESVGSLRRAGGRWALGDLSMVPVPPLLRQVTTIRPVGGGGRGGGIGAARHGRASDRGARAGDDRGGGALRPRAHPRGALPRRANTPAAGVAPPGGGDVADASRPGSRSGGPPLPPGRGSARHRVAARGR
jgi:hypothetical protein